MNEPGLLAHTVFLLVGVVVPLVALLRPAAPSDGAAGAEPGARPEPLSTGEKLTMYWANSAFLWLLAGLCLFAWHRGGNSIEALGLRAGRGDALSWSVLGIVALLYVADVAYKLASPERLRETAKQWQRDTPFMPANGSEVLHSTVLMASAGFCEEVAFRGFVISYLHELLGGGGAGAAAAVVIPALLFAVSHRYQGWAGVVRVVVMAVGFGVFYLRTGLLWPLVVLHFAIDLNGSLLGPRLMRAET